MHLGEIFKDETIAHKRFWMDKKTEDCLFWGNEDGVGISSQKKCSGSVLMSVPFSSLFGRNSPLPTSFICLEKQYKFWESKSLKHTNHRIILKGFLKCSTIKKKKSHHWNYWGMLCCWAWYGMKAWSMGWSVGLWLNPWWGHSSLTDNSGVFTVVLFCVSLGHLLFTAVYVLGREL